MRLTSNEGDLRTSLILCASLSPPACLRLTQRSQEWVSFVQLEDSDDFVLESSAGPVSTAQWQKQRIFEIGRQLHTCDRCLNPPMRPQCLQNDAVNFAADYMRRLRSSLTFEDAAMICEVVFGPLCLLVNPVVVDSVLHSRMAPYILTALEICLAGERPEACWHSLAVLKGIAASRSDAADRSPLAFQEVAALSDLATAKADLHALLDVSLAIRWRNGPTNVESSATAYLNGLALLHHSSKALPVAECWALAVKIRKHHNSPSPCPNELLYALRGLQLVGATSGRLTSDMMAKINCVDWKALLSGKQTLADFERRTGVRLNRIPSILNENVSSLVDRIASYSQPVLSDNPELKTVVSFLREFWLRYLNTLSRLVMGSIVGTEMYRRAKVCSAFYGREGADFGQTFRWRTALLNSLLYLSPSETSRRLQGLYSTRTPPAESSPKLTPLQGDQFEDLLMATSEKPQKLRASLLSVMVEALQQVMEPHAFLRQLIIAKKSDASVKVHSRLFAWPAAMRKCQLRLQIDSRDCVSESFGAQRVAATLPDLRSVCRISRVSDHGMDLAIVCINVLRRMLELLPRSERLSLQKELDDSVDALQEITQQTTRSVLSRAERSRVHKQAKTMYARRQCPSKHASRRVSIFSSDTDDDREGSEDDWEGTQTEARKDSTTVKCSPHLLLSGASQTHTTSQLGQRTMAIGWVTLGTVHC
ncbi:MAG: uncharacterized protein KVP18_000578 [Porospora cf. gigantea A]|uniref:uncharacterized protein n=2 Tax=Porospora cf. gigantea A TaxID=2853593 RepID=UPI00355955F3|nr:MAG: hypothetical protein KVP18_000578 [Porospora cf. gigantea A]